MSDKVEMIQVNSSFLGSAGMDLIALFVPGDLLEGATRLQYWLYSSAWSWKT